MYRFKVGLYPDLNESQTRFYCRTTIRPPDVGDDCRSDANLGFGFWLRSGWIEPKIKLKAHRRTLAVSETAPVFLVGF